MVGGGEVGMEVMVVVLASRMTFWAVGGRRSHPVSLFLPCAGRQWQGGALLRCATWSSCKSERP